VTQVSRGNRPGVAMPIRIHELLLSLAGRLDDDALADARQMLASAELDRSLEFVAGCLAAGGVVLSGAQHRELEELFANTYLDPSVIDRVVARDTAQPYRHRFAVGAVDGEEPDHGVPEAIRPVLDVLPDVRSVWCVWRLTPSGPVSGPVPHRVVLVGVGPGGFAPATAYRVEYALRRAGIRASVEVLVDGGQPTDYHQEAMRCARQVPFDDPGPGGGGGRPPMSPVEPVRAEAYAAEPAKAGVSTRAKATTMLADAEAPEETPAARAPVAELKSAPEPVIPAEVSRVAEPAPAAKAVESSVLDAGTGRASSVESVAGPTRGTNPVGSGRASLVPLAEAAQAAEPVPVAESVPGPASGAGLRVASESLPVADLASNAQPRSVADQGSGTSPARGAETTRFAPVAKPVPAAESVPVAESGRVGESPRGLSDVPGADSGRAAEPPRGVRDVGAAPVVSVDEPLRDVNPVPDAGSASDADSDRAGEPPRGVSPVADVASVSSTRTAESLRSVSDVPGVASELGTDFGRAVEPLRSASDMPGVASASGTDFGRAVEPLRSANDVPGAASVSSTDSGSAAGVSSALGAESTPVGESTSGAEPRAGSESLPVADLTPSAQAEPAPVAEAVPFRQTADAPEAESKPPSPFAVEPPKIDSVRAVPPTPPPPSERPSPPLRLSRPRPVESIKSVFEQEPEPEADNSRPSPRRRQRGQDDPPSRPRLVPAAPPAEPTKDRHAAAFVDEMLNTRELNLLRELQDELARREKQENQSGPWRSGRHGKPFEPGQVAVNGVPPRQDRGYGSA
jgi:hypothetical protein